MNRYFKYIHQYIAFLLILGIFSSLFYGQTTISKVWAVDPTSFTLGDAELLKEGKLLGPDLQLDGLSYKAELLHPDEDPDGDGILTKDEVSITYVNQRRAIVFKTHPLLKDTDGDGLSDGEEVAQGKNPLVWDVSARDMVMFTELVYRDDDYIHKVLDHTQDLTDLYEGRAHYKMMHNELSPYWKVVKTYHNTDNGFDAVIFTTKSDLYFLPDGEVHIVGIRGTKGSQDVKEDTWIALGSRPYQAFETPKVLKDLAGMNPKNVYATGHSLGGWLSQYMLAYAHLDGNYPWMKKAYTFNAPNIRANGFQKRDFKNIRDKSIELSNNGTSVHYATSNDSITNATGRMHNYIDVGRTDGGHSSLSYFEDKISNRTDFQQGERNTLNGEGRRSELFSERFTEKPTPNEETRPALNELFPVEKKNEEAVDIYDPVSVEQVKALILDRIKEIPSRPHTQITFEPEPSLDQSYGTIHTTRVSYHYPDDTVAFADLQYRYLVNKEELLNLWVDIQRRLQNSHTSEEAERNYRPQSLELWHAWKNNERLAILTKIDQASRNDALTPAEKETLLGEARASIQRLTQALAARKLVVDKTPLQRQSEKLLQLQNFDEHSKTNKSVAAFRKRLADLNVTAMLEELASFLQDTDFAKNASEETVTNLEARAHALVQEVTESLSLLEEKADARLLEQEKQSLEEKLNVIFNRELYLADSALTAYEHSRAEATNTLQTINTLLADKDNLTLPAVEAALTKIRASVSDLSEKEQALTIKPSKEVLRQLYTEIQNAKNQLLEERYTPSSWQNYLQSLNEAQVLEHLQNAKAVLDNDQANEEQINAQVTALQQAKIAFENSQAHLKLKANKDKLRALLNQFEQILEFVKILDTRYTPSSVQVFLDKLRQVTEESVKPAKEKVDSEDASEEEVQDLQAKLQAALTELERAKLDLVVLADKTDLTHALNAFEQLFTPEALANLHLERMTPASKEQYETELSKLNPETLLLNAKEMLANAEATLAEVRAMAQTLNDAHLKVQALRTHLVPLANKEQLMTLVKHLESLVQQALSNKNYTKNTFDPYQAEKDKAKAILKQAQTLLEDANAAQEQISDMEKAVAQATNLLTEKLRALVPQASLEDVLAYEPVLSNWLNLSLEGKTEDSKQRYQEELRKQNLTDLLAQIEAAKQDVNFTEEKKAELLERLKAADTAMRAVASLLKDQSKPDENGTVQPNVPDNVPDKNKPDGTVYPILTVEDIFEVPLSNQPVKDHVPNTGAFS